MHAVDQVERDEVRAAEIQGAWEELCRFEMLRFGHREARVYPFLRMAPLVGDGVPLVETKKGIARVLGVAGQLVEVVLERDLQRYRADEKSYGRRLREAKDYGQPPPPTPQLCSHQLRINQVGYPTTPPPRWQVQSYQFWLAEMHRRRNQHEEENPRE